MQNSHVMSVKEPLSGRLKKRLEGWLLAMNRKQIYALKSRNSRNRQLADMTAYLKATTRRTRQLGLTSQGTSMTNENGGTEKPNEAIVTDTPSQASPSGEPAGDAMRNPLDIPGEVERRRNWAKAELRKWVERKSDA